jgi:hypothetical protein
VPYAARHRIRGRQPGEPVHRERLTAGHQHQVPEPPAAQHSSIGNESHLRKHRARRRDLRPCVRQRRAVRHVGREHALFAQYPPDGAHEFDRGQMGRSAPSGEHVRDHHVVGAAPQPLEHLPRVADPDPDPDPAQRQPEPDQVHQCRVDLDGQLR